MRLCRDVAKERLIVTALNAALGWWLLAVSPLAKLLGRRATCAVSQLGVDCRPPAIARRTARSRRNGRCIPSALGAHIASIGRMCPAL